MRTAIAISVVLIATISAVAQKKEVPPPRFGIEADLDVYPQDTPQAALTSALKAIDARRFAYFAAQLADPTVVDKQVQDLCGKFESYVKLVTDRLSDDPEAVRQLRRFSSEGEFNVSGDAATVSHKEIKGRQVFLKKIGSRWFLEDRQEPLKDK